MSDPIPVSRLVRLALVFGGWCQAVWVCAAFMVVPAAVSLQSTHFDAITFASGTRNVEGTLRDVITHEVRLRHGYTSYRYEHRFTFEVEGRRVSGTSWSLEPCDESEGIDVDYLESDPRKSRIVGHDSKEVSPALLVLGLVFLLTAGGWSAWLWLSVRERAEEIRDELSRAKPYTAHGWLPKLRVDRSGRLFTRSAVGVLVAPILALLAAVLLLVQLPTL